MSKYELSISTDYVASWTIPDALRELVQNAIDEETVNKHTMYVRYENETRSVVVANRGAKLDIKTLLFGNTTKANDPRCIGQHGEGYKVAMIVALRNNCVFTIYNGLDGTRWETHLVKSRKYDGAIVPTITTHYFDNYERTNYSDGLYIKVSNVNYSDYNMMLTNTRQLHNDLVNSVVDTPKGSILKNPEEAGRVYVGGLYICKNVALKYGYDMMPELVSLDRDRRLISDYDLQSATGKVICATNDEEFISDMSDEFDGTYVRWYTSSAFDDEITKKFFEKYGPSAIPVCNNTEFEEAQKRGLYPVMVSTGRHELITKSSTYSCYIAPTIRPQSTFIKRFEAWYNENHQSNEELTAQFSNYMKELGDYLW